MSEFRKDLLNQKWTIVASGRKTRPSDFKGEDESRKICSFCEGNEKLTPPETFAFRDATTGPDVPGWQVRVVPNKYPALDPSEILLQSKVDFYEVMSGFGAHEVIIEGPNHDISLSNISIDQLEKILKTYILRYQHWSGNPHLKYILIIKNQGCFAGASLEHSHSQLFATPLIPAKVLEELAFSEEYYKKYKSCLYCDVIEREKSEQVRVVLENECFIAFCPYASRFPFEIYLLPKRHLSLFEDISKREESQLALIMKELFTRLNYALDNPPYNYFIHVSPANTTPPFYHWHIEIIPRLSSTMGGFEWGTGIFINSVKPEDAACVLRDVKLDQ
ncbi:MAG: galactose-1-phosphate uridylyltransferase [Actinobacteria bacterium]|nr:galactose-1-phosphate uridylyltransferase [Actinomycetota bacterium]